jgi:hypothetical protein
VKFFVIESLKPKSDKLTTEGVMRTLWTNIDASQYDKTIEILIELWAIFKCESSTFVIDREEIKEMWEKFFNRHPQFR